MIENRLLLVGSCLACIVFPCSAQELVVSGEDLAWKVENHLFVVDFSRNPRTGRSGQINTIYLKSPLDVFLTRGSESSTLHLSPNLARGGGWVGVNRWDPVLEFSVEKEAGKFSLFRRGPMPEVPEIVATCRYEIRAESPAILVEETMEVIEDTHVSLLRLDEWSVVPEERNPFTHMGWSGPGGRIVFSERVGNPRLPLDTDWVAFYSAKKGFGFASVMVDFSLLGSGADRPALAHEGLCFGGEPHYFYRALIYPPGVIGEGSPDPLVAVKKGAAYSIRYYLFFFESRGEGVGALEPVVDFWRSVRSQQSAR